MLKQPIKAFQTLSLSITSVFKSNIKLSSFKSSENIQKKEVGPDSTVSNNQFFSVTLNELAMNAREREREREREEREHAIISSFTETVNRKTHINPKGAKIAQICLEDMILAHQIVFRIFTHFNKAYLVSYF